MISKASGALTRKFHDLAKPMSYLAKPCALLSFRSQAQQLRLFLVKFLLGQGPRVQQFFVSF